MRMCTTMTDQRCCGGAHLRGHSNLYACCAAGLGLGAYYDTSECFRSRLAWPVQLRHTLQSRQASAIDFEFPACAGATTEDLIDNQLSALTADTDLVTMTIGGNDVGFASVIRCAMPRRWAVLAGCTRLHDSCKQDVVACHPAGRAVEPLDCMHVSHARCSVTCSQSCPCASPTAS